MKYPIGIQSFSEIRTKDFVYVDKTSLLYRLVTEGKYYFLSTKDFVYVDKTSLLYRLVTEGKYYFLSRPRRFGKSLLLSTFEAYFEGKKELFEGLAISRLEEEWERYPILHLDLNTAKYDCREALERQLDFHLHQWEEVYGSESYEKDLWSRFQGVIRRACERTGHQVVILIDEYDKPLRCSPNTVPRSRHSTEP